MIKVMIADDQELIRQSLQIVLSTHEDLKVVDAVENGFAVLESIKKEKPDVILRIFVCQRWMVFIVSKTVMGKVS